MFLVGGSIVLHGLPFSHALLDGIGELAGQIPVIGGVAQAMAPTVTEALAGLVTGLLCLLLWKLASLCRSHG